MLDILMFIFSSFWIWLGFAILLSTVLLPTVVTVEGTVKAIVTMLLATRR